MVSTPEELVVTNWFAVSPVLVVVPKAEVSVRSEESAPPPWSGKVVLTFLVVGTAPSVL